MSRIKCYPAYFNKCDQQLKPISCFKLTIFFGYFLENEMLKTSWSIAGQLAEWNKTQLPKNRLYSYWTKLLPLNVHCNRQAQSWNVFCFHGLQHLQSLASLILSPVYWSYHDIQKSTEIFQSCFTLSYDSFWALF